MTLAELCPLALDLGLAAVIVLMLLADLSTKGPQKRALPDIAAALMLGLFAASFSIDTSGAALFGAYQGGPWPLFFKRVFLIAGALATLGSAEYVLREHLTRAGEYYILMMFSLLGMMLLPGCRDLITLVVCFELMSLPLFVLAAYGKNDVRNGRQRAPEAALKLYLVGALSSVITLFGLSLIFGLAQTTALSELATAPPSGLLSLGVLMVIAGMGFKIGAVPFHMWVPDTYEGAGTPFVAFLSVAPKLSGFSALVLVFGGGVEAHPELWVPSAVALSVVSIVFGNLLAIRQTNLKRLLGYSGVAQIGYMLMAWAAGGPLGTATLLFYAAGYVATNMGAFFVVTAVAAAGGDDSVASLDGLARRDPYLALAMLVFLLSLAGIPFVVGFWAKFYVFAAAWSAGYAWLVILGAVFAVVGLYYYLRVARAMYMQTPSDTRPVPVATALHLAITSCLLLVVGIGVWPRPFVDAAFAAARAFAGQ